MTVTGRKHNTDDIIATVLAVEPMKFIYRGRIAVFSSKVLRDERICVIAEQRPDCSEEEVKKLFKLIIYLMKYNFSLLFFLRGREVLKATCLAIFFDLPHTREEKYNLQYFYRVFNGCLEFSKLLIVYIKLAFTV